MIKYLSCLLLLLSLSSFGVIAQEELANQYETSLDASIVSLEYDRAKAFQSNGIAGQVSFTSVQFFKGDLTLALDNKDKLFDSEIFARKGFVGFKGQYVNIGFSLADGNIINTLQNGRIKNTQLKMHGKYLLIDSENIKASIPTADVDFSNAKIFCTKHPSHPELSTDSLIIGCLTQATLNSRTKDQPVSVAISLHDSATRDKANNFNLNTEINAITVSDTSIIVDAKKLSLDILNTGMLTGAGLKVECKKDPDYVKFDIKNLAEVCLNDMLINGKTVSYNDTAANKRYDIALNSASVQNELLRANLSSLTIRSVADFTTLHDTTFACTKLKESDLFSPIDILSGCLHSSSIHVTNISTNPKEEVTNVEKIIEYDIVKAMKPSVSRTTLKKKKDGTKAVKNIDVTVNGGKYALTSNIDWAMFEFDFEMYGTATIENSNNKSEIVVFVEKTKLPLGITSKNLLFYFLNKYMVGEGIRIDKDGKKIYIDITSMMEVKDE